jgi:uncharacterized protein (DUF2062 family)
MEYPILVALKQCWIPASAMVALLSTFYAISEYRRRKREKKGPRSLETESRAA